MSEIDITDRLRHEQSMNPSGDEYIHEVIGRSADTIADLRRRLSDANARIARLQAECRAWSAWCDAQRGGKVVPVKGHAARAAVDANNDLGEQSDHPVNEGAD